jgi:hypothetical protein
MKLKYSELRGSLRTCDLVLFSGGGFFSRLIKFFTRSNISHIGIIITDKENGICYIMESTTMSPISNKRGVQINLAKDVILNYKGGIFIKPLNSFTVSKEISNKLKEIRRQLNGRPYERNFWELAKSEIDITFGKLFRNKPSMKSVFCSELVAHIYKELGILKGSLPANEYTPADFMDMEDGKLNPPYTFGETKQVIK